jgi:site-specific DNA-adenine methylase
MPIISYFGSKSSNNFIKDLINPKIPREGIKTYIEPFSGSFSTYMDDDTLNFENVIYNDRNRHQVNLMYCCSKPETFIKYLEKLKTTFLHTP